MLTEENKALIAEQLHYPNTLESFFMFLLKNKIPFIPLVEPDGSCISFTYIFFNYELSILEQYRYKTDNPYTISICPCNGEAAAKLFFKGFQHTTYWVSFCPSVKGQVAESSKLFKTKKENVC